MASTKADNNRVAWRYTTADGEHFRTSAKNVYVNDGTDGSKFGGQAAAADMRPLPASFRPRRVKCVSAAGITRAVVCYDTTCALWATPGTTVTLNLNGTDTVFTSSADQVSERYGRSVKQQS